MPAAFSDGGIRALPLSSSKEKQGLADHDATTSVGRVEGWANVPTLSCFSNPLMMPFWLGESLHSFRHYTLLFYSVQFHRVLTIYLLCDPNCPHVPRFLTQKRTISSNIISLFLLLCFINSFLTKSFMAQIPVTVGSFTQKQVRGCAALLTCIGPGCHLHMRWLRHLRMPTSLVHAKASTTSLVHAHTFWVGWVGWVGW